MRWLRVGMACADRRVRPLNRETRGGGRDGRLADGAAFDRALDNERYRIAFFRNVATESGCE